ncbi:hypothetical protein DFH29DRAFT_878333 [Suillus ampliporus]|nr:hypothetical protein DFH29DRAFT_878333 [Suillus ampliporus]
MRVHLKGGIIIARYSKTRARASTTAIETQDVQNEDEMLTDEHESQITKTGEMDDISLNDEEAILVDQDVSNNDMDVVSLDEEDVMLIDQDVSNNGDMDVFSLDEDDVMNIDQDEIMV